MPPANDDFASAQNIAGGSGTVAGSNVGATAEVGEPTTIFNDPSGATVWFGWTAPTSETYQVDTQTSSFDTMLDVFTGTTLANLARVAGNDDFFGAQSRVLVGAVTGQRYWIRIQGFNPTDVGSIVLNWAPAALPSVFSATPPSGMAGDAVVLNGYHLDQVAFIDIGGLFPPFGAPDPGHIDFTVPSGLGGGPKLISIFFPPSYNRVDEISFIALEGPPTITAMSPDHAHPGDLIQLEGTNLDSVSAVTIRGLPQSIEYQDPTLLQFRVAVGTVTGPVSLAHPLGTYAGPVLTILGDVIWDKAFATRYIAPTSSVPSPMTTLVADDRLAVKTRVKMVASDFVIGGITPGLGDQFARAIVTGVPDALSVDVEVTADEISYWAAYSAFGAGVLGDGSRPGFYSLGTDLAADGVGLALGRPPGGIDTRNPVIYIFLADPDSGVVTFSQQFWDRSNWAQWVSDDARCCALSPTLALMFPQSGVDLTGFFSLGPTWKGTLCQIVTLAGTSIVSVKPQATYVAIGGGSPARNDNYNFCPEDAASGHEMSVGLVERVSDETALIVYADVVSGEIWARLVTVVDDHTLSLGARIDLGTRGAIGGGFNSFNIPVVRLAGDDWLITLPKVTGDYPPGGGSDFGSFVFARLSIVGGILTLVSLNVGPDLYELPGDTHYHGWIFEPLGSWLDQPHDLVALVDEASSPYVAPVTGATVPPGLTIVSDDPTDTSLVFNVDRHAPYDSTDTPELTEKYPPYSFDARDRYVFPALGPGGPLEPIAVYSYPGMTDAMLYIAQIGGPAPYFITGAGMEMGLLRLPKRVDVADEASLWRIDLPHDFSIAPVTELEVVTGTVDEPSGRQTAGVDVGTLWADRSIIWAAGPSSGPGALAELAHDNQAPFSVLSRVGAGDVRVVGTPVGTPAYVAAVIAGVPTVAEISAGAITRTWTVTSGRMPVAMAVAHGQVFIVDGTNVVTVLDLGSGTQTTFTWTPNWGAATAIDYSAAVDRLGIIVRTANPFTGGNQVSLVMLTTVATPNVWDSGQPLLWQSPSAPFDPRFHFLSLEADGMGAWFYPQQNNVIYRVRAHPHEATVLDQIITVDDALMDFPLNPGLNGLWVPTALGPAGVLDIPLRQRQRNDGLTTGAARVSAGKNAPTSTQRSSRVLGRNSYS